MKLKFVCLLYAALFAGGLAERIAAAETNAAPTNAAAPAAKAGDLAAFFRMHWDDRVRAFKEQNLLWQNVVMLGDSITEGFDVAKYFPGRHVLNRGIGADVIGNGLPADDHRGLLRRLDCSVYDCAPADVFVMIGINDLGSGHTIAVMEAGYREMLERLHTNAPLARVHLESLLPTRGRFARHNANVLRFNARLRKLGAEFGCDYLDLHRLMVDDHGELKAEFTSDGLHINDLGYQLWQAEINKTLGWR